MPTAPLGDLLDEMAATIQAVLDAELGAGFGQAVGRRNFNPTPPSIDIYPGDPFREDAAAGFEASGRRGELILTVRARVTTVDNTAGQDLLLRFMDDQDDIGVTPALQDDPTLNGLASSVQVTGDTGYLRYVGEGGDESGGGYLGCEWRVRVIRAFS